MRGRIIFGAVLVLLISTLSAMAGGICSTPQHYAQSVVLTPAAIQVPLYGAVFQPQQAQPLTDDVLREILAEMKALREEIAAMREGRQPLTMPANVGPILNARCAACHELKVAEAKGAGFVMTDDKGQPWRLSGPEKRAVREQVTSGKMPRGGSLTPAEKAVILNAAK